LPGQDYEEFAGTEICEGTLASLGSFGYILTVTSWDREILEAVAAGRLSPEEAARALEEGKQDRAEDSPDPAPPPLHDSAEGGPPPGDAPTGGGPDVRVQITATARSVRVIGDPGIVEASVEGRHRAERVGNTIVIEGSPKPDDEDGFSFEGPGSWHRHWHHWRQVTEPLVVRVHTAAAVSAEVSAGSLSIQGVTGPLSVVIAAGSARLEDVNGPLDVEARAGAVRISGRIEAHQSRIRCEAGSVSLHLRPGSSAVVRARAELGRIRIHGLAPTDSMFGGVREATVGAGTATVDVETTMGSVDIFSDEWVANADASR
jgi:hypothetical protein